MNKICLDTNIFGALSRNEKDVVSLITEASNIFVSFVVYAELLAGFKNGNRAKENRNRFSEFMRKNGVVLIHSSNETIEIYSDIYVQLRRKGTPIPTNDMWIAAQAIETGSVLLTFDHHFEHIPGLRMHTWR